MEEAIVQLNSKVIYFIGVTLLIGLVYSKKFWDTPSAYILVYLSILLFVEYIGSKIENNHWLYNIQSFMELLIFTLIFYGSLKVKRSKKAVLFLFAFCCFWLLMEMLFVAENGYLTYLSYSFGLISFVIPLMCFLFLFEMTNSEKVLYHNRVLLYWISIGLMVYHLCNLPTTVLINDLFEMGNYELLYGIQVISGMTMYICFSIGFVWSYRKYNI